MTPSTIMGIVEDHARVHSRRLDEADQASMPGVSYWHWSISTPTSTCWQGGAGPLRSPHKLPSSHLHTFSKDTP